MKIQLLELYAPDRKDVSIYVAEGRVECAAGLAGHCGAVLRSVLPPSADTAFTVVSRAASDEKGRKALLLEKFEHWFCHEFPHNVEPFSVEVVERYWQSIARGARENKDAVAGDASGISGACPEFAALLVHRGQYVFCGLGEWTVCEYSFQKKRSRRWHTGEERKLLDRELGIPVEEPSDLIFLHGSVPVGTLYLILPRQVRLEYPKKINSSHQLQQFMETLRGQVPFAVAVNVSE